MTQHIGIVACSAEGAALCYRTLCQGGSHPQVSLHGHALADYVACLERGDLEGVGELMLSSAHKLAQAGATFLICPDNTIHQALPLIEDRSPLPWLHIAQVVAREAQARGYQRVGITGTRWLMESSVYPAQCTALGLTSVMPDVAERIEINRIIMEELVDGICKPEAVAYFQQVIRGLQEAGCEAVVLGCTEIPLIMNDANSPLPTLDSTRLLARAALAHAAAIVT